MLPEESNNDTAQKRARRAFEALISGEDAAIDLAMGALLIAAEEYPDLNIAHYLTQLDLLAQKVAEASGLSSSAFQNATTLPSNIDPLQVVQAINKVLFEQEKISLMPPLLFEPTGR